MKKKLLNIIKITVGCILFAAAFALFLEPHLIAPGGISALAMGVDYITGIPLGVGILVMNIPLFILSFVKFGPRFIASTIYATVLSSLLIDIGIAYLPTFTEDILLASLYGGVLMGAGMGLIFLAGSTTGGSDILSKLIRLKFPHVKLGKIVLLVDVCIIIMCAAIFKDINLALYAVISLYVSSLIIDAIIYGSDNAVLSYIISDKSEEIGDEIQDKLERGITYLSGIGGYTQSDKKVIICAVRRNQSTALGDLVKTIDPDAFLIFTEAYQVFGFGFSRYKNSALH